MATYNPDNEAYFEYYFPPGKENSLVTLLVADELGNLKFWDLTRFIDWQGTNTPQYRKDQAESFAEYGLRQPSQLFAHHLKGELVPSSVECKEYSLTKTSYIAGRFKREASLD